MYVPEQVARALQRFFQEGSLMTLRELALRSAANRVDGEMRAWMESRSIECPWATMEHLLVCVSGSPYSERLIRATLRLGLGPSILTAFAGAVVRHVEETRDSRLALLLYGGSPGWSGWPVRRASRGMQRKWG